MKRIKIIFILLITLVSMNVYSQEIEFTENRLKAVNVFMSIDKTQDQEVLRVVKDPLVEQFDEPTFVKFAGLDFVNGTIGVKVLSRLLEDAPDFSRGFIGIAFRINEDHSKFESIYLRPTNARADNQVRRNHSIQYFAYPDYKYERLRKESPELYESYADMTLNEWISMKIVVRGNSAKLFINENEQPSLIITDLKLGNNVRGTIGLWVDVGTEGFFKDLRINKE